MRRGELRPRRTIMVSNGLSKRRRVLKRPIVCKSKTNKLCGDCTLTIDSPQQFSTPGQICEFQIALDCDPDPMDLIFNLTMQGAWTPTEPAPVLMVNNVAIWHATSPALVGLYEVRIDAINSSKCHHFGSIKMRVN